MKNSIKRKIKEFILIVLLSIFLTISSSLISCYGFYDGLIKNIFVEYQIFLLNLLPIIFLVYILRYLFKSLRASFLFMSLLLNIGAYANFVKIVYRQEALKAVDLTILFEAFKMSQKYSLMLNSPNAKILLASLIITFIIFFALKDRELSNQKRLGKIAVSTLALIIFTKIFLFSPAIYAKLGSNLEELNTWIELNSYQAKGFVYPFIYSIKATMPYKYKDYDEKRAEEIYSSYDYQEIPQGKKVSVVVVMLESFKDFYKLQNDNMTFTSDPYWYFHDLQKESISGDLLVNSFGGGTFKTEINALTGYKHTPEFNRQVISYPRYLKENGYTNYAFHPNTGIFYNRKNVYKNIAFDEFFELDNTFSEFAEYPLMDEQFYDYINQKFNSTLGPRFFFAVTYQNHGPYPSDHAEYEEPYIEWKDNYNQEDYIYFNNYLHGIESASNSLKIIVDNLQESPEPTVFLIFGDHSPSMGENYKINKMLGINSDTGSQEGVRNIYQTPYLIWANQEAKNILNNDFKGEGRELEPIFLFSELFRTMGYEANQYNQFLRDFSDDFPVIKETLFKTTEGFTTDLNYNQKKRLTDFYNVEYYTSKKKI
ncbi:LTA synthase family protein [Peptoniphilus obesi]|uniref:LTA synthase family protein n=1 Tax=Peptoniphilus obesi TaxID=1472765 RepID=UPI0004B777D4|nr:alkaline phosphatase family protein [Peptoniphilus obesi]